MGLYYKYRSKEMVKKMSVQSNRIGPSGRSFHCKVTPLKGSGSGRIKYIHGLSQTRDDVLISDDRNDVDKLIELADIVDKNHAKEAVRRASAYSIVIELPREALLLSDAELRRLANKLSDETTMHPKPFRMSLDTKRATWAIHDDNHDKPHNNPHLHIVTTVGTAVHKIIDAPSSMSTFRHAIASKINKAVPYAEWHGGTLADTGITREAKKRLPMAVYKAREEVEKLHAKGIQVSPKRAKLAKAANKIEKQWEAEFKNKAANSLQKIIEKQLEPEETSMKKPSPAPLDPVKTPSRRRVKKKTHGIGD